MHASGPGTLNVKCISAKLTRDTETFGKMDPYCKVTIKGQVLKTRTHNNAGKNPIWNQVLKFKIQPGRDDELQLAVYDEDMTKDDLVGESTYFLDEVVRKGRVVENITIAYKGRSSGLVTLELEFVKDAVDLQP